MESVWKEKTNYYTIINDYDLQNILDEMLVDIVGYDPNKVWTLGNINTNYVARGVKHLEDNKVALNIQVCNPQWTDVKLNDGSSINALGVIDYINTQDFDLAKYYFQVDEFLSQEEYDALVDINTIEII